MHAVRSATISSSLAALPREAWVLFLGTFLNKFGTFALPFLAICLTQQGYSAGAVGWVMGAYGTGHLLAAGLGGILADKLGRRPTIVLSMFGAALAMLALSQARRLDEWMFLAWLAGLTGELYRPAGTALLADVVPTEYRVTAFAAYRLAFNAGWAFGPATAGLLAQHSFLWLFIGDAATSLLFGLVAWAALPNRPPQVRQEAPWREWLREFGRDRLFLQLLTAVLLVGLVFMQVCSTLSLACTANGLSARSYGTLLSMNGALVVLFELPITRVTRRFRPRPVIAIGFLLIGLGFCLTSMVHHLTGFALVIGLFTLGEMISMPVAGAYVADLAPPHLRGRYMGLYGFVWALTLVFGPLLGTRLFAEDPRYLWYGCGVLGAASASIMLANPRLALSVNAALHSAVARLPATSRAENRQPLS